MESKRERAEEERKWKSRFGHFRSGNPVSFTQKQIQRLKLKQVSKSGEPDKSARAVCSREQTLVLLKIQPDARLEWKLGVRLDSLLGHFRSLNRAKQKPKFNIFSIRTQRCNPFLEIPWHAFPEIKNERYTNQNDFQPERKLFPRLL